MNKYGLVWEYKKEELVEKCKQNKLKLVEDKEKSILSNPNDPNHILIEGDNYPSLSLLSNDYTGKIDVIYIDPPYNTGKRDWKYNNDYVDKEDTYPNSKWLSMLDVRVRLAKKLLKSDGVFICAINKSEVHRLGLLFEQIFTDHEIHCITIIHNPRGIRGKNFSYNHEYLFFIFPKGLNVIENRKINEDDVDWLNFRNGGGESLRNTSKNCFYSIIVKNNEIVGFGDVLEDYEHPSQQIVKYDGKLHIYPIDIQGIERKWRYARQSVEKVKSYLRVRKTRSSYEIEMGKNYGTVRTVWRDSRYDCSHHGTKALHDILPTIDFAFPKSLHAVYDCLEIIVRNRKNAIILDFFAGSGTTGHAVLQLNNEDKGSRQFILCTNNEGGICTDVCYPRIKKVMTGYTTPKLKVIDGLGGNLNYFRNLVTLYK